jgi:hypothetical protein
MWKTFLAWWSVLPTKPVVLDQPAVGEFLIYLHNLGLKAQTIREYLSLLASTFQPQLTDSWGSDKRLTFQIRGFSARELRPVTTTPKWNINVVLRYLQADDFFPLRRLDFPSLARRTAFLLLFASAARISEATAWADQVDFVPEVSATLFTIGGFRPKNTSRHRLHRPLPPLIIPSLDSFTTDPVELRLCPVRNLHAYCQRAVLRRRDRKTLFFPYTKNSEMTTAAFARWITRLIIDAYTWGDKIDILPDRPTSHEIRAIATSYAAFRQVPFDKLLQMCHWQSASVFTSRYLRDLHDLSFLSSVPVVAAGVALPACAQ